MKYSALLMERTRSRLFVLSVTIIVIVFIIGYLQGFQNKPIVKIGINAWAGYDPFILADKLDLFNKNGVQLELTRFSSATKEMQAMQDGVIQGGGFTLDEVFSLIQNGYQGKVVLIVDYSMGGDMIIGQSTIRNLADLEGKVVGYEGSVVGEFLLDQALSSHGVKKSAVTLVNVQAERWLSAFNNKEVDALVCFNPVASRLLHKYEGNLLFSSADIPFEIIDVLLFSKPFYHDHQAAIGNILKAWFEALRYIDEQPDHAAKIITSVKNTTVDNYKLGLTGLIAPNLQSNLNIFQPESDKNIYKYSQVIVDFMLSRNMISNRINTTDLFELNPLSKLHQSAENKGVKQ